MQNHSKLASSAAFNNASKHNARIQRWRESHLILTLQSRSKQLVIVVGIKEKIKICYLIDDLRSGSNEVPIAVDAETQLATKISP